MDLGLGQHERLLDDRALLDHRALADQLAAALLILGPDELELVDLLTNAIVINAADSKWLSTAAGRVEAQEHSTLVILAAINCAVQGWLRDLPLMMGISLVGVASGATNLVFAFRRTPTRWAYLIEHMKALVGAGISVYTAFMTFGLVRFLPRTGPAESHAALNPALWAVPLTIGLAIIIYHRVRIGRWGQRAASPRVQVAE